MLSVFVHYLRPLIWHFAPPIITPPNSIRANICLYCFPISWTSIVWSQRSELSIQDWWRTWRAPLPSVQLSTYLYSLLHARPCLDCLCTDSQATHQPTHWRILYRCSWGDFQPKMCSLMCRWLYVMVGRTCWFNNRVFRHCGTLWLRLKSLNFPL